MIDEVPDYVIWGCRSGSKTYLFGGLDTFLKSCSKSKYSTKILGGSEGQSSLTYSAISEFFEITGLGRELLVDVMHKTQAEWVNGSTVSILPASTKSVRGPHTVALKLDEVDEIDPLIYEDALPIPQSMHGHKSVTGMFSTNHQVNGQMDEAIRRAKDAGGNIFRYCFDDKTEVLTNRGWKKFKDVWLMDYVLSLNPKTHTPEWVTVRNKINYHYNGELIHFYSNSVDVMVTPNHRMYARKDHQSYWDLIPAEDLVKNKHFQFCRESVWGIEHPEMVTLDGYTIPTNLFCTFMGWYLSEGCIRKCNRIKISQKDVKLLSKIMDCCFELATYTDITSIAHYENCVEFRSVFLSKYLKQFGKSLDKCVPKIIKNMSTEQIRVFLNTYLLGDGGISQRGQLVYYTSSPKMEADLGELLLKVGSFPSYTIRKNHTSANVMYAIRELHSKTATAHWEKIPYNGDVSCVELRRNHVMLTRRNGKCSWQGNCVWEILEPCLDYECSTCKLSPFCPGKHMKEADGYYKIEDFTNKLSKMSLNAVMRDYFCKKVGKGDAVYEVEYNEDVNLISASLDYNKPVAISVDWGGTDPFSLGVWQELPTDRFEPGSWVRVTEIYLDSKDGKSVTNKQLMALARQSPWWKQIKWFVGDSGRPDLIQEWREALPSSVEFIECDKKSVEEGIECVKAALKPVLGAPKLYINRICMAWRIEVTTYVKKNDKPVDRYNHTADDTRYFVKAMINKEKNAEVICPERDVRPSR